MFGRPWPGPDMGHVLHGQQQRPEARPVRVREGGRVYLTLGPARTVTADATCNTKYCSLVMIRRSRKTRRGKPVTHHPIAGKHTRAVTPCSSVLPVSACVLSMCVHSVCARASHVYSVCICTVSGVCIPDQDWPHWTASGGAHRTEQGSPQAGSRGAGAYLVDVRAGMGKCPPSATTTLAATTPDRLCEAHVFKVL